MRLPRGFVVRIVRPVLLSLATSGLMIGLFTTSTGCNDKPADGTVIEQAGPMSEEGKAAHKKYYDRSKMIKKTGKR
jgi:hypothetical protein